MYTPVYSKHYVIANSRTKQTICHKLKAGFLYFTKAKNNKPLLIRILMVRYLPIWCAISFAVHGLMTFGVELLLVYLMIKKWKTGNFQVGEFVLFQTIIIMLIQRLWEFGRNFRNFFHHFGRRIGNGGGFQEGRY